MLALKTSVSAAHHEVSEDIDLSAPQEVIGKVAFVEWTNPHVTVHVLTDDLPGAQKYWLIQADSPSALLSRGISRATLEDTDPIAVTQYASNINSCTTTCVSYGLSFTDSSGNVQILSAEIAALLSELRFGN
ncbi:MAG: DUF6152 family protein [Pseudohongiellaceae bacterium]